MYLIALGILAVYSYLGYRYTQYTHLAPVTAVATTTTDFIIYLLVGTELANGPVKIAVLLVGFRSFLFGFGTSKWFIGYCLIYILIGVFLAFHLM